MRVTCRPILHTSSQLQWVVQLHAQMNTVNGVTGKALEMVCANSLNFDLLCNQPINSGDALSENYAQYDGFLYPITQ